MVEPAFATLADDAYTFAASTLTTVGNTIHLVWQGYIEVFVIAPYHLVKDGANWLWNDGLDHATNFFTGFSDIITFGGTKAIRQHFGMDYVNYDSWMYTGGQGAGLIVGIGLGGGVRAAG